MRKRKLKDLMFDKLMKINLNKDLEDLLSCLTEPNLINLHLEPENANNI